MREQRQMEEELCRRETFNKMKNDFSLLFWIHLILIICIYISPFIISWKLILVFIFLYYLQLIIFGDCILTRKQFKTNKRSETFYHYYLYKLGFKIDKYKVRWTVDYIIPWIILIVAISLQSLFSIFPLIRFLA